MKTTHRIGTLAAATLGAATLAATPVPAVAAPPAQPLSYHGVVTGVLAMNGPGCVPGDYSGTWAVDIPDRRGDTVVVTMSLLLDGAPHADWTIPMFSRTGPATPSQFSATFVPFWTTGDVLTVSMKDAVFLFTLDSSIDMQCTATFVGTTTP